MGKENKEIDVTKMKTMRNGRRREEEYTEKEEMKKQEVTKTIMKANKSREQYRGK